jgi:hypothetical protein
MEPYIFTLFQISLEAIQSANNEVAHAAVEFWDHVCTAELDLADLAQEVFIYTIFFQAVTLGPRTR